MPWDGQRLALCVLAVKLRDQRRHSVLARWTPRQLTPRARRPPTRPRTSISFGVLLVFVVPLATLVYRRVLLVLGRGASPSSFRRVRNVLYPYGVSDTIGRRPYMEDRHVVAGELRGDPLSSLYAVFDGHAGHAAADYCVQRLVPLLVGDAAFPLAPVKALASAFVRTDAEVRPPAGVGDRKEREACLRCLVVVAGIASTQPLAPRRGRRTAGMHPRSPVPRWPPRRSS